MAYFQWSDSLSVGNVFIDNDHKHLIGLINKLHDAMAARNGTAVVDKILFDLLVYTKGHFKREEDEMRRIQYPGYEAHVREHRQLIEQVNWLQDMKEKDSTTVCIQVADFLQDWLRKHILGSDMALARAIPAANFIT